jgi:putative colanic acid biosynthesis acetyltransferase WcaF
MTVANSKGTDDPYLQPAFTFSNRVRRAFWNCTYALLFRYSPRPLHRWRAFLLRRFGARLGSNCRIYPKARIWAPWNLICDELATVADGAIVYNPSPIEIGSHAILSQEAFLCGATHDLEKPGFQLVSGPITIGPYAWICARATVQMGVRVSEGAVLGLGAVATKDLEPWTIYGGIPARKLRPRPRL